MSQAAMPSSDSGNAMPSAPRRIIGYYAGWTAKTKNFTPADIPADKLTHVNYAFGLIDEHGRAMLQDAEADIGHADVASNPDPGNLGGNFHQFRLLKERHLLDDDLDGWLDRLGTILRCRRDRGEAASDDRLMHRNVSTRRPGIFDGIDIDWRYPVCCGLPENAYRPEDRRNCTLLFEELRRQLDALGTATGQRYLLTAAIPAGREIPVTSFELRGGQILDWINVMTYDMTALSAVASPTSTPRSPNRATTERSRLEALRSVVGTSVPSSTRGAARQGRRRPVYGRGFAGVPAANDGLYQPFTDTISADYHTIKADYLPVYRQIPPSRSRVPWLYDPARGTCSPTMIPSRSAARPTTSWPKVLAGSCSGNCRGDKESSLLTAICRG